MEAKLSPKAGAYALQLTPQLKELRDPSVISGISSMSAAELGEADGGVVQRPPSMLEAVKEGPRRQLKVMSIVGLCYFSVCGGPIGSEYIISAGGPLVGFIMLLLFPFIFGIPIAYVTAELSTTFPQDGKFSGCWVGSTRLTFLLMLSRRLHMATFTDVYGSIDSPVAEYFVKAAIAVLLALPNLLGIRIVGRGMAVMSIFVMIPFTVLFIWGLIRASNWGEIGEVRRADIEYDVNDNFVSMSGSVDIDWSLLINTLFWNFNGAVNMSVFGGEVSTPGRTYPRALLISVLLVTLTYLAPLFAATVYNSPHWTTWEEGSFSSIARDIGGGFLSNWVVLATFCSNAGMYIAELFCDSFQLLGMAECGLAPAVFKARNKRFNTPHNSVYASLIIILVLIQFDFDVIQNMTNALSAFYQLLILVAFIKMRYTHADIERPFKVPGSIPVLLIGLVVPTGLLVYIAVDVFFTLAPAMIVLGVTLAGLLYARWRKFTRAQFRQLAANTEE
ncbi:hypothetical protein PHYBOEH_011975 [Phytophthora boehmeriae]|uniref:Amino Acid-Polyamine-Organocation (APC) Family n=1 Tax=Phytophthora boehmeriae TaxID=109152 RepID=A0A8T1X0A1_9STRA|nr:hypothetical protein PHYBOEH_011975 [Phytophthora boehmeriae]